MKKTVTLLLAAMLISSTVLSSCGDTPAESSAESSAEASAAESAGENTEETESDGPVNLSIWTGLHALEAKVVKDKSENEAVQKFLEGYDKEVNIEWIHPPVGMEQENFNLMVTSGDLPDIIINDFSSYKGGAVKAMDDGILLDVTDLVEEYAPNFQKYFYSDPDTKRAVFSDDGRLLSFGIHTPTMDLETGEPSNLCYTGLMVRSDLMQNAGYTVDTLRTVDDWENMLTSFKDQGVVPLMWAASDWDIIKPWFLGAYGVGTDFYLDGDTVKFGPIEDGYRQWLETFARWYQNGLIDPNFTTYKYFDNVQTDMMAVKGGATGYHIYDYKIYHDAVAADDPSKALIPVRYPVLNEGDIFHFQDAARNFCESPMMITTACENPVEAVKFIDYQYTVDASIIANWGIEGKSYEIDDTGAYHFTDEFNSDESYRWMYTTDTFRGLVDVGVQYESYLSKEQPDARALWDTGDQDAICKLPPNGLVKTSEESLEYSQLMGDINTYVSEMTFGFIMGDIPLSDWDSYVQTIKDMNIDRAIAITQATYDRYLAR